MIKEKITALIKKDNKNNKRKIENLIFAFILLVITLISINIIFKGDKKNNTDTNEIKISNVTSQNEISINNDIEERLDVYKRQGLVFLFLLKYKDFHTQ